MGRLLPSGCSRNLEGVIFTAEMPGGGGEMEEEETAFSQGLISVTVVVRGWQLPATGRFSQEEEKGAGRFLGWAPLAED